MFPDLLTGLVQDCAPFQQKLHKNLVYLATVADSQGSGMGLGPSSSPSSAGHGPPPSAQSRQYCFINLHYMKIKINASCLAVHKFIFLILTFQRELMACLVKEKQVFRMAHRMVHHQTVKTISILNSKNFTFLLSYHIKWRLSNSVTLNF